VAYTITPRAKLFQATKSQAKQHQMEQNLAMNP